MGAMEDMVIKPLSLNLFAHLIPNINFQAEWVVTVAMVNKIYLIFAVITKFIFKLTGGEGGYGIKTFISIFYNLQI